jgi:hypothetical protein
MANQVFNLALFCQEEFVGWLVNYQLEHGFKFYLVGYNPF